MSRIRTVWALALWFPFIAGWTYAGERSTVRETARITLHQWVSQDGDWQYPSDFVGDCDVATTQIWISQDGAVGAGSSWSTGETPAEWGVTDIVLVDGVASQVSMTSGLDQSAITVARMDVTENYKGDLGLPGTPLQLEVSDILTMRGFGTLHYESGGGAVVLLDSPNHLSALSLPSGIILGLYVKEGHADVGASAVFSGGVVTFGPYATVTIAGSANTGPHYIHCLDGTMDPGLRGPAGGLTRPTIEVAGGLLKLHKLTGATNYFYLKQSGGVIDFDIKESNGTGLKMQLRAGTADFRKCQYVFSSLGTESYILPGANIVPGPATTEAILTASGILDFRGLFP